MGYSPLVSIIIPVYNVEHYLSECLDSVLNQTYKSIEVILVDDGSTDNSVHICDEYSSKDSRVLVIHKNNEGVSSARNDGTLASSGEYITYVDSDDYWRGEYHLSNIIKLINDTNGDVICFSKILQYSNGTEILPPGCVDVATINSKSKGEVLSYLIKNGQFEVSAWSKVIKRDLIIRNKIEFERGLVSAEDIDWNFHIFMCAERVVVYNRPFYIYRQGRLGSTTSLLNELNYENLLYVIKKWRVYFINSDMNIEEKELYLGYLAYQFGVLIGLLASVNPKIRAKFFSKMIECEDLLQYSNNHKSQKISFLYKFFGVVLTSWVLGVYVHLKTKGYIYK